MSDDENSLELVPKASKRYAANTNNNAPVPQPKQGSNKLGFLRGQPQDFVSLDKQMILNDHHQSRPLWILPDGHIFLEAFNPHYIQATDFLVSIAAPESRSLFIHEYQLTPFSLYAAVSVGLTTEDIIKGLNRLAKNEVPKNIITFITQCTKSYGKVKLVLQKNSHFVETSYPDVLQALLQDSGIISYRVHGTDVKLTTRNIENPIQGLKKIKVEVNTSDTILLDDDEDKSDLFASTAHSFEVQSAKAQLVKKRCIELDFPMLEEYDFRNDTRNPNLDIDLKLSTTIRPYQEKSLSKMFGNGRARSGIIVLPCGAGKSLVGITAACTIKKSCLVLATNGVSAQQWKDQFRLWSTIEEREIAKFTSDSKEMFSTSSGVVVTTYSMLAYGGRRSEDSEKVMRVLRSKEWGLLLLDEVHVVPAKLFRKVLDVTKTHCKLGLTATLVREDNKTEDLNFLIGPKLYEANWMDLSRSGYIASVQCFEVWCPMTGPFYKEYLKTDSFRMRTLLYVMNPVKFRLTKFLMEFHEARGDKVIIFADNIHALKVYGVQLNRPLIYGKTGEKERQTFLNRFKSTSESNTILLSKVGDNSIDLPEANVIIQVSSHFGSRRQEAQRLGRILRPKAKSEEQFNAFFYSLVSKDTEEMKYSSKRQQFLVDQGYSFKILTSDDLSTTTQGWSPQEEEKVLKEVLTIGDQAGEIEENTNELDDWPRSSKSGGTASRSNVNLNTISGGGSDLSYGERPMSIANLRKQTNKIRKQ